MPRPPATGSLVPTRGTSTTDGFVVSSRPTAIGSIRSPAERLLDVGARGAEVVRLVVEVVDGGVELGLVEVGVPLVVASVGADEPVGGAVERVLLVGDLVGDGVAGVVADVAGGRVDVGHGVDVGRALGVGEAG